MLDKQCKIADTDNMPIIYCQGKRGLSYMSNLTIYVSTSEEANKISNALYRKCIASTTGLHNPGHRIFIFKEKNKEAELQKILKRYRKVISYG